jgi:predicted metal-dependent hydrolase
VARLFPKTAGQLDREIADHQARDRLKRRIQKLLDKWQPILGVKIREFHVKTMTAWASINPPDRRLWISLALGKMSDAALEYVIVHELVHLVINEGPAGSGHDDRFYALMDHHLPTWRRRHARLYSGGVRAVKLPGM